MRLILLGAPGAGKGTQAAVLAEHFGIPHVSSGELVRQAIASGSELGRRAEHYASRGELVPDDVVLGIISEGLTLTAPGDRWLLDGFPRTLAQAERAYEAAGTRGTTAHAVIYLSVPDDVARERLLHRHEGRVDDADPAVIDRRLRVFHAETEPLLDFYRGRGILHTVDASRPPEEVTASMFRELETIG